MPNNHPLRAIKRHADEVLKGVRRAPDNALSETEQPGIPPDVLRNVLSLQALYSVPSE